jgi:hypothetical protein
VIDLPKKLTNGAFDNQLERGSVLKTLLRGGNGKEHLKYLVVLNRDISRDPIVFVLTTSKLDFYNKHPEFNRDIIRIIPPKVSFFSKKTIINCREVHRMPKETLKINYQKGRLEFAGILLQELLQQIDNIVLRSFYIPNSDKKLILGNNINASQNPLPT